MPYFRPSCVVNLKLKFDEALTLAKTNDAQKLRTDKDSPKAADSGTEPLITGTDSSNDDTSWVMARIPSGLTYEMPGYRQAWKFEFTLNFRDLPIDPRTVRAAAVEIHTGCVSDSDFAQGFKGKDDQGRYRSVLQTRKEDGTVNADTLRMVGIVDEWEVSHEESGSTVRMSGRDLRGVLLDCPIGPADVKDSQLLDSIDWSKPVNEVVAQILAFNPFFDGMSVVINDKDWPDGVPAPGLSKGGVLRHRTGARGKKDAAPTKPEAGSSQLNFWDLIVKTCYMVGAIPYIRGTDLAIRPASTVFDKLRGPIDPDKNPTPFAGGNPRSKDAATGKSISPELRTRLIVYGRDTSQLRINRKFAGWRKPKVIRCISVDMDATSTEGQLVQGIWPPEAAKEAKKTSKSPGDGGSKEDVVNVPVPGVKDPERLELIAKSIYEEIGRGELGGECTTKNLASFGGDNTDPDLLRLEPGDGIEFNVDTRTIRSGVAPLVSSYTDSLRRSFDDQVAEVEKRLKDRNLARVIVATARGQVAELQRFFRVSTVKGAWSEDGLQISFDFQNYVVTRAQVEDAPKADGKAKVKSPVGNQNKQDQNPGGQSKQNGQTTQRSDQPKKTMGQMRNKDNETSTGAGDSTDNPDFVGF